MKTQQPEQTARTSQHNVPMPTTDVEAESVVSTNQPAVPRIGLTVPERFLLNLLLPTTGNRKQMTVSASVEQLITFDEGEAIMFGIRHSEDGNLFFNETGHAAIGFEFDAEQVALIKYAVKVADGENRITREMLSLLAKIDLL